MDKTELENTKQEYLRLLNTLIVKPKNAPGYYPAASQTQLYALESKIKMLYSLVGEKENNWCQEEKEKVLKACFIDTAPRKKKMYVAVAIVAVIVVIFIVRFVSYLSSLSDIHIFEDKIKAGDSYVSQSKQNNAIDSYVAAYSNYDGYNSDDYKEQAFSKIKTSLNEIIKKAEVDNRQLYIAVQTVNNLNNIDLGKNENDYIQKLSDELKSKVDVRLKQGFNNLTTNIYNNKGKLDQDGKKLLEDLILLSPTDYWLTFIKNKENEQNR